MRWMKTLTLGARHVFVLCECLSLFFLLLFLECGRLDLVCCQGPLCRVTCAAAVFLFSPSPSPGGCAHKVKRKKKENGGSDYTRQKRATLIGLLCIQYASSWAVRCWLLLTITDRHTQTDQPRPDKFFSHHFFPSPVFSLSAFFFSLLNKLSK